MSTFHSTQIAQLADRACGPPGRWRRAEGSAQPRRAMTIPDAVRSLTPPRPWTLSRLQCPQTVVETAVAGGGLMGLKVWRSLHPNRHRVAGWLWL